jgi:hypothetical protein
MYEQAASSDYRLNHRLRVTCKADIEGLCREACSPKNDGQVGWENPQPLTQPSVRPVYSTQQRFVFLCQPSTLRPLTPAVHLSSTPRPSTHPQLCGGAVLRCLTERQDDLKSDACRKEVFYFERMEVEDFHNDVILAAACRGDVEKFCKGVEPGGWRAGEAAAAAGVSRGEARFLNPSTGPVCHSLLSHARGKRSDRPSPQATTAASTRASAPSAPSCQSRAATRSSSWSRPRASASSCGPTCSSRAPTSAGCSARTSNRATRACSGGCVVVGGDGRLCGSGLGGFIGAT